ncbi:UDP-glucuronosyl and UDP-glucosyl transferase [Handroanthus impetiginosus]|uniref:Glycosyltransferase n=1 Tax=Handroanthus impetiginosus TaxID=429701 RepID=A0A2G9H4X6_9LAMI|nr:UDP-glucuronosyl and UDP-glucosyl transferase [Handroanthus impetiginosus]
MSSPHVLVFPFMAKGHAIPLLQLTRFLLRHSATVTLVTTPGNRPFICHCLSDTTATIIDIPFPQDVQGIPPGVESTDKLPDISLWLDLATATKLMQPHFEQMLESLPPISFMITDFFLSWTLDSANKFSIPRLPFYPMGIFAFLLPRLVSQKRFFKEDEGIKIVDFPWIRLKKEDFDPVFIDPEGVKGTRAYDFTLEAVKATSKSYGIVVNSFYELESVFSDFWNTNIGPPVWCFGPLPLAEPPKIKQANYQTPWWISWLDHMHEEGKSVLYVAFGTQAEISPTQFREIQTGLEESGVNFVWVVRNNGTQIEEVFEERVRNRGIVVREWVDQREILEHESVRGFLCHCGWSSLMEGICAKVPILALPLMWEQPLNAKLVVEVAGIGLRVERDDGLAKAAKELMEGKAGEEVRKKVEKIGSAAARAVKEGGSSWKALNRLISELHGAHCILDTKI